MSTRSNVGQSTIGGMGIGVDTVSPEATAVGEATVTATPTAVILSEAHAVGSATAEAEIFRISQRITLSGTIDATIELP